MSRWEEVLDIQMAVHDFLTSDTGTSFGAGWFAATYREHVDITSPGNIWTTEDAAARNGAVWAKQTGVSVFNAEPIYVDPDMMTLVENAVQTFRPEPLQETDLITREGLLVLPRPLWLGVMPGREGIDVRLNWSLATWRITANGLGIILCLIHDQNAPDELDEREDGRQMVKALLGARWVPTHVVNWAFGANHPQYDDKSLSDAATREASPNGAHDVQLQTQAIWRLLNQTIAIREKYRPPRPFVKRAAKAKLPSEHVTIVRLRRPSSPPKEGEPSVVHWTHRWIVGGHWRWQWYRDDESTAHCGHIEPDGRVCMATGGRHKQIWISPFQKGPENAELIVNKARIFVLER